MTESLARVNWRKELLYLGLAAMESCWFYPWLLLITPHSNFRRIPFIAILSILLLALYLTRLLGQEVISLLTQRIATIALALLSALLLLRLYIYADYSFGDISWLGRFAWEVGNVLQRIPPSLVAFFASLYLWWRGISLAQREFGVDAVGFSFRLGIITFFWFLLVTVFGSPIDARPFIFVYFFLGLIVMGLARIEDISHSQVGIRSPFDASWMGILMTSTLAVSALSLLTVGLLSLHNIAALLHQLQPIAALLEKVTYPLLIVLAWLLELLLTLLIRIFKAAWGTAGLEEPLSYLSEQLHEFQQIASPAYGPPPLVLQVLQWGFLTLVLASVLAVLVLSINRRWQALQAGRTGEYQSIWEAESTAKEIKNALQSRWRGLHETLLSKLGQLRGEDYSLASIRHIYASLVKLAAAAGFPRREAETPYEYTATLCQAFPGSEEDIMLITEAYVRTHYGERIFQPEYVQRVRNAWLAIRTRQEQAVSS